MQVDEKIARGLTNAETRMVVKAASVERLPPLRDPSHPLRAILKPLQWRYTTRREPDPAHMAKAMAEVSALFPDSPSNLRLVREVGRRYDRASYKFQRVWLEPVSEGAGGDAYLLQAKSLTVDVDRGLVICNENGLFHMTAHAVERVHLRTMLPLDRRALKSFGGDVVDRIGMVTHMLPVASISSHRRMAWPFADGLVLGLCERVAKERSSLQILRTGYGEPTEFRDEPVLGNYGNDGMSLAFRIATFVGPRQMSDRQKNLRDRMEGLFASERRMFRHMETVMTCPRDMADEEFPENGYKRMAVKIAMLLADKDNQIAMGNFDGFTDDVEDLLAAKELAVINEEITEDEFRRYSR
jgi:hypothetical protein